MNQARINPANTGPTDMADMDAERQREIELLVKSALELNVYDRRPFLDKACAGDESLRREVESLLVAHERPVETIVGEQTELKTPRMPEVSTKEGQHSATTLIDGEQNFKFAPGEILDGRYMIEHELGIGGIGQVFLAQNLKLPGRVRVVIKVLREQTLEREDRDWFEIKFRAEIEALSRIEHPGVVNALDAGQLPDGRTYFVMQYIPGKTLRSVMQPQGMDPKRAADLLRKIAQALDAAHEKAVIHRDLKPANIMLQTAGREEYIKIIDFGIATVLGTVAAANPKQTKSIGTLPYMAPEQMFGRPIAASDIFALGVIAFEMVTGQLPFNADTTAQQIELQRVGVGEKLRELCVRLPEAAGAAILKAIDFEASNRFRTAREFSEAFDQALAESDRADLFHTTPVPTALPQQAKLTRPLAPRRKWLAFIAGVIVTLLLAVAVGTVAFFSLAPAPVIERTTANPAPSPTAAPERGLSYSLLALKNPARYPGGKLFTPLGDVNFKAGDQVRLNVSVPQSGYLYVINEGPERANEPPDFVVMFPKAGDSAQVAANQTIQIPAPSEKPENDWFVLNEEKGVEKIWLIWSEQAVAQLEEIKNLGNPKDIGLVRDPNQIKSVARYLKELATTEADLEKDETNGLTKLKGRGGVLAGVVRLRHQ